MKKKSYPAKISYYTGEKDLEEMPGFEENLEGKEGWTVIEDSFLHFFVSNMNIISLGKHVCPYSNPEDGLIELQFIRASTARSKMIKAMVIGLENPKKVFDVEKKMPLKNSGIECFQVKAWRLEPTEKRGYFSIDGEVTLNSKSAN